MAANLSIYVMLHNINYMYIWDIFGILDHNVIWRLGARNRCISTVAMKGHGVNIYYLAI